MHGLLEPLIKEEHADLHLNVKGYDVGASSLSNFPSGKNDLGRYITTIVDAVDF